MVDQSLFEVNGASFRDPAGYVFHKDGFIYRSVSNLYRDHYDYLFSSGLYAKLVENKLLIPHEEISFSQDDYPSAYKILKPIQIPFISYPYEWSFNQLKDAALHILKIQRISIDYGMTLKDSPAQNIQFYEGKPLLIDTLSFEIFKPNIPWSGYLQFCQHYLAPLALIQNLDYRLNILTSSNIDGIPLDLASSILPIKTWFKLGFLLHIHLHARSILLNQEYKKDYVNSKHRYSLNSFKGLTESLENTVKNIECKVKKSLWNDYYETLSANNVYLKHKFEIIAEILGLCELKTVWDFGSNTGIISRIIAKKSQLVISFDHDSLCVDQNYLLVKSNHEKNLLPLLLNITNASPASGWNGKERMSLFERGPVDTIVALALVHHIVIKNNIPIDSLANYFQKNCNYLIIEFIPKEDPNVQKLLNNREDIFTLYTQKNFEIEFEKQFITLYQKNVLNSTRSIYLFKNKNNKN